MIAGYMSQKFGYDYPEEEANKNTNVKTFNATCKDLIESAKSYNEFIDKNNPDQFAEYSRIKAEDVEYEEDEKNNILSEEEKIEKETGLSGEDLETYLNEVEQEDNYYGDEGYGEKEIVNMTDLQYEATKRYDK